MPPQKIFLDYDSTLVDLVTPWFDWLERTHGIFLSPRDIPRFGYVERAFGSKTSDFFRADGSYGLVSPLPGAVAFVDILKTLFGEQNVFVISASYDNHKREKEAHALRHFGVRAGQFLHSEEKHLHTGRGVLVDDHPKHVVSHIAENSGVGVLFTGNGEYAWSNLENYADDPIVSGSVRRMDRSLLHVCGTYDDILSVLRPAA